MKKLINIPKSLLSVATMLTTIAILCSSCSKNDPQGNDSAATLTNGALLQVGFGATTYATPTDEERAMESVALIIESENGELHKYFSSEPIGSAHGFEKAVQDASGNYLSVLVRLPAADLGTSNIVALANYDDPTGIALRSATTMAEVTALKMVAPTTGLATPLLMYDQKPGVTFGGGVGNSIELKMKRAAARIQIPVSFGIDFGTGGSATVDELIAGGRLKCFALLYNPKSQSYLLPSGNITSLPQIERFTGEVHYKNGHITLYTYEMTGDEPQLLKAFIICRYQATEGGEWQDELQAVEPTVGGKSAFFRNTTYTTAGLSFNITIADFDEGEGLIGG